MPLFERLALRVVRALDAACHRLFGWRWNPLHQSGALACLLLVVLIATGLYLLLFYRVGTPWESVQRLQAQWWLGRWMRGVHRLASDLLVVAAVAHAVRMFAQARSWGPRTMAWVSGVFLLLFTFVSGWTGFVLVWDRFGGTLALAGARMMDSLPILSEPLVRVFQGERPVPGAFFFINLFLHIAIPLGMGAGLWLHVARLARPVLLPPRGLSVAGVIGMLVVVLALPMPLDAKFDPFAIAAAVPLDLSYAFWLPVADRLPAALAWTGAVLTFTAALLVPMLTRRARAGAWAPSVVDPATCTGCEQCPQDCPWDAITMVPRPEPRGAHSALVALVDPSLCVSCGLCAASCAPMGVGPLHRSGRDQIPRIRAFAREALQVPGQVVAVTCENAAPRQLTALASRGAVVYPVPCTGNMHSSVVELALRGGAAGVIVYSCPPRDCRGREGPTWLEQRIYREREAELQARVDKRRVALATMAIGDLPGTLTAFTTFRQRVAGLVPPGLDPSSEMEVACEPPAPHVGAPT